MTSSRDEYSLKVRHTPIRDEFFIVSPSTCVKDIAIKLSIGENVAAAIVVEDNVPKGIIVKDDILRKAVLIDKEWTALKAVDIMSSPVWTIDADDDFRKVLDIFVEKCILAVPVVQKKKLIGVCTIFDACKQLYQYSNYIDSMLQNIDQFTPSSTSKGE
ncbi:MAG: cyclic nucleotide-binding/CBS domain-containing protein [Promethearchaeota archaeon]